MFHNRVCGITFLTVFVVFVTRVYLSNGLGCPVATFACLTSGDCVNDTKLCDTHYDCVDGSDEENCGVICPHGWFHCHDGNNCIPMSWVCDAGADCADRSDELNCGKVAGKCAHDEFRCHDNRKCIAMSQVCNGHPHCDDGSDETPGCTSTEPCVGFACTTSHDCVPLKWTCDGSDDCLDGSDEANCTQLVDRSCLESDFRFLCSDKVLCLEHHLVCNNIRNCDDGSDEGGQCELHTCKTAGCSHGCFQTPVKAVCNCPLGYLLESNNKTCKDIDECAVLGACSQTCKNTIGSFICACQSGYKLIDSHKCQVEEPEPVLIFSATHELKMIKLRSGLPQTVHEDLSHAVGVDYNSATGNIYWTEIANEEEAIKSSKLDGSDVKTIVSNGISVVEDIAIDWVGSNLYFADSGLFRLVVCQHDGALCAVLIDGLLQPRAVVLEPSRGLMFWSDWSHTPLIERAGMDGSERIKLVTKNLGWPNGLAIDYSLQCLFWLDAKLQRIESVTFDGGNRRLVMENMMAHPFALAVFEDTFYWTDWERNTLESCNKFTGGDHTVLVTESADNVPMGVHIYHPVTQRASVNPCWNNRCSQLCLLSPGTKRYSCACKLGDTLAADGLTCNGSSTSRFFLAIEDTLYEFHEAELGSTHLKPMASRAKMSIGALAYNPVAKTIVYTDLGTKEIISLSIKTQKQATLLDTHLGTVSGLAVDWISGNIYWTDSVRRTIEVSMGTGFHRMVLVDSRLDHPVSLALAPNRGVLFVACQGNRPRIETMDMDGSDRHLFLDYDVSSPSSLVVDHQRERLYWVDSAAGKVEVATLDGKQRRVVTAEPIHPSAVAVGERRVLWTDTAEGKLGWSYKVVSETDDSYGPAFLMSLHPHHRGKVTSGMRLLAVDANVPKVNSTGCGFANGQCSHLCLANKKGFVCACPIGMALREDDRTSCRAEVKCNSHEFTCGDGTCVPLAFVCDGGRDCTDGADEKNCRAECDEAKEYRCGDGKCIPIGWKCDHKHDCVDLSDELNCDAVTCPSDFFSCAVGGCVYASFQCDGSSDCLDDSDEVGCPHVMPPSCSPGYFRCNNSHCISETWRCDGEVDCRDGSDEGDFCAVVLVMCNSKKEFTCANGRCVELDLVCDRDDDCGDGSDEANCDNNLQETKCPSSLYRCPESNHCILPSAVCDGFKDCFPRGEDEEDCKTVDLPTHGCPEGMFQCLDRKLCVMSSWTCDGDHDCEDMSDETLDRCHVASTTTTVKPKQSGSRDVVTSTPSNRKPHLEGRSMTSTTTAKVDFNCPSGQFQCNNSRLCVSFDRLCDYRSDCPDRSDEGEFCAKACATDNGGCSDLCLPTSAGPRCQCQTGHTLDAETGKKCRDVNECLLPRLCGQLCHNLEGTYACSCVSGYSLRPDHRSCKAEGPMPLLLLAYSAKLLSYTLGDTNHVEVLASSHHGGDSNHSITDIRDVDFDASTGSAYFVDAGLGAVLRVSITNSSDTEVVLDGLFSPTTIAVDWLAKLLVYVDRRGYLTVCTLSSPRFCADVLDVGSLRMGGIQLDPRRGLLYWAAWGVGSDGSSSGGVVERVRMNGNRRGLLASEKVVKPTGLALDFLHETLYWVDSGRHTLVIMDTSGNNRHEIAHQYLDTPVGLVLFEDRLYWANWGSNMIVDCDKFTCDDRSVTLDHSMKVKAMTIYHPVQQQNASCPCTTLPKKCSHICVTVPNGYSCLCPSGMRFNDSSETNCVNVTGRGRSLDRSSTLSCTKDNDCFNGGTCVTQFGTRVCACALHFVGERCEINPGPNLGARRTESGADGGMISGIVIGLIFVVAAAGAAMLYYKRFSFDKLRGAFSPLPFVNPEFDEATGEPLDGHGPVAITSTGKELSYRSYDNPLFDGIEHLDMKPNFSDVRVAYHVSKSQTSLDSTMGCEPTLTLLDPTNRSKR